MPKFKGVIINNRPIFSVQIMPFSPLNEKNNINTFHKALIDTGATMTTISTKVVSALNLIPSTKRPMQSATHIIEANVYAIQLDIPITEILDQQDGKQPVIYEHRKHFKIEAMEAPNLSNQGIDVLLGMDIISQCLFIVDGNQFTFCF